MKSGLIAFHTSGRKEYQIALAICFALILYRLWTNYLDMQDYSTIALNFTEDFFSYEVEQCKIRMVYDIGVLIVLLAIFVMNSGFVTKEGWYHFGRKRPQLIEVISQNQEIQFRLRHNGRLLFSIEDSPEKKTEVCIFPERRKGGNFMISKIMVVVFIVLGIVTLIVTVRNFVLVYRKAKEDTVLQWRFPSMFFLVVYFVVVFSLIMTIVLNLTEIQAVSLKDKAFYDALLYSGYLLTWGSLEMNLSGFITKNGWYGMDGREYHLKGHTMSGTISLYKEEDTTRTPFITMTDSPKNREKFSALMVKS